MSEKKKKISKLRTVAGLLILVTFLVLVVLLASLRFLSPWILPRIALKPTTSVTSTPQSAGMAYEDVTLATSDGLRLNAWYVPAKPSRGTLLFFHGRAGNISGRVDSIEIFHRLGLSVLIIDYRGFGQSEGRRSIDGTALDALAAWKWLTEERNIPTDDIIVFGRSFGGAVAMQLMRHARPRGLILESTFTSLPEMIRRDYLVPLARLLVGNVLNSVEVARTLDIPVLCIHSRGDEVVPYRFGRRLYDAVASKEKSFLDIHGSHNSGFRKSAEIYIPALDAFVTACLGPK